MKKTMLLLLTFSLALGAMSAQNDHAMVEKALQNYLDALYLAKPELIRESVHPKLNKVGFYRSAADQPYSKMLTMSYERLEKLAGEWNAERKPITVPAKAEVLGVHDRIAFGRVSAEWGFDYCQLVKEEGKWLIINIVWQSPE